jgi:hypothetical protein
MEPSSLRLSTVIHSDDLKSQKYDNSCNRLLMPANESAEVAFTTSATSEDLASFDSYDNLLTKDFNPLSAIVNINQTNQIVLPNLHSNYSNSFETSSCNQQIPNQWSSSSLSILSSPDSTSSPASVYSTSPSSSIASSSSLHDNTTFTFDQMLCEDSCQQIGLFDGQQTGQTGGQQTGAPVNNQSMQVRVCLFNSVILDFFDQMQIKLYNMSMLNNF